MLRMIVFRFFLRLRVAVRILVLGIFLLRLSPDEAVEIGERSVKLQRRMIFFERLAHHPHYYM